jgi:hypothetical protein
VDILTIRIVAIFSRIRISRIRISRILSEDTIRIPVFVVNTVWERYADDIKMDREYTQKSLRKCKVSGGIARREQKHHFPDKMVRYEK